MLYYQVVALITGMLPPLATRGRPDQRYAAAIAVSVVAAGSAILLLLPALAIVACTLLGLVAGVCLVLALTFRSQRATGPHETTALPGMAQSIGYLVAAGPLLLGILDDATANWTGALLLTALSLLLAAAGYGAGRDHHVPAQH
ncbi:hypothetical protein ACIBCD_43210 [Nocardia brasiliensis]|uniref:hypothetical protein n=1 Tax=Nocardia brasiliensis TaxID=37326 RepID=UPI0037A08334